MTDAEAINECERLRHDGKTASELIEEGVGLIAKGIFRKGDKSGENNPRAAYDAGLAAVSVIRGMAFDFLRQADKPTQPTQLREGSWETFS